MNQLNGWINYILSFEPYVLLPVMIFAFALVFRISAGKAIHSSLKIGIGFIGIFVFFDFFVSNIGPAVKALVAKTGLHFHALDVGWPPLAAITWSYKLVPLLMISIILLNIILLVLKLTKTVNIDLWNFWHFIFMGTLVYETTGNLLLSVIATLVSEVITLKIADFSVPAVKKFSGLEGISISNLSAVVYYPFGVLGNCLLDRIPGIRKIHADPEAINRRLGFAGQPMVMGFVLGCLLGLGAGYGVKQILELAFVIAAVIYIIPLMGGILADGLIPISEGMKKFIQHKLPWIKDTHIGLDLAVLLKNPSILVTAILLMPAALVLAFILPGINFIPIGDLANIIGAVSMVAVATQGNVLRSFIIFLPIMIGKLYVASHMAGFYTTLATKADFHFEGYTGTITSFLDGGNLFRCWLLKVFELEWFSLLLIPIVILLLYFAYKKKNAFNTP